MIKRPRGNIVSRRENGVRETLWTQEIPKRDRRERTREMERVGGIGEMDRWKHSLEQ